MCDCTRDQIYFKGCTCPAGRKELKAERARHRPARHRSEYLHPSEVAAPTPAVVETVAKGCGTGKHTHVLTIQRSGFGGVYFTISKCHCGADSAAVWAGCPEYAKSQQGLPYRGHNIEWDPVYKRVATEAACSACGAVLKSAP